jgi:uncharacterized protein (TIGR02145 family)
MKTNKLILLTLLAGSIFLLTCKKVEKLMLVKTGTISNILITTADISGTVLDLGDGATQHGHCYATSPNPNVSGTKTELGTPALGGFTSALTGLTSGTKYYIKAYLSRGKDVVYGDEINFTTASAALPELTTTIGSAVTKTSAVSGGNITNQGGTPVTARGVCWSLATITTLTNNKTIDGTGIGTFTSDITGLTAGTNYYVRAYATNSGGTKLGNEVTFTTNSDAPVLPTATTSTANPDITSATLHGIVNANGQSTTVTFEYGLTNSYGSNAIASPSPISGTNNVDVSASVTGLTGGTLYHFRVRAENGGGVTYGLDQTFTTLCAAPTATTNTATDKTNISATVRGTVNANDFSTTVIFEYGLTTGYGSTASDIQGVLSGTSPTYVSANLSGLQPNTIYHFRVTATNCGGTVSGIDQTFTTNCTAPSAVTNAVTNAGVTIATINGTVNANNFSSEMNFEYGTTISYGSSVAALPGTVTGTNNTSVSANLTGLTTNNVYHYRVNAINCGGTTHGSDMTFTTLPTVTLDYFISDLNVVLCQGTIITGGGAGIIEKGFCWNTSQNPTINDNKTTNGPGTGPYTGYTSSLTMNTEYYFRAYATNNAGTSYSDQYLIKTSAGTVTDADGNLYSSVTIGTQVWMKENLRTTKYNDGTSIPLVTDPTEWSSMITAGYCWYNNDASTYKLDYGALYNRYVNTAKLCPAGWHVATLNDFITLENYNGGVNIAGGKLKEIGTMHWTSPNTSATNASGFTAVPGGWRTDSGVFQHIGTNSCIWTSDNYSGSMGWYFYLINNSAQVNNTGLSYKYGNSVRCVKD